MRRRDFISAVAAAAPFGWASTARSQARRIHAVGILTNTSRADPRVWIVGETLRALGYVQERNIHYVFRLSEGRQERLPDLAKELVAMGVDVIVAAATPATKAAQQATGTIPIVGIAMADPVRDGLVRNYASPEANITGNTFLGPELVPKRLSFLKELLPTIARVEVLWHPEAYAKQTMDDMVAETQRAAVALNLRLNFVAANKPEELDDAFAKLAKDSPEAMLEFPSQMFYANREALVRLAAQHRIPSMWNAREFVELGGLIMYGTSLMDLSRQAAIYVDKLLKGAKPSELPVEQPTKFELLINAGTARELNIPIPPNLLARADEVIE
jgi:putative tryptophan/tyrosine transport system substrate-binding protein